MLRNFMLRLPSVQLIPVRTVAKKRAPKLDKKMIAAAESLAARGFLRPNKPYTPPDNITEIVEKICSENNLKPNDDFQELDVKFKVLSACFNETGHSVPNSLLYSIQCVDDVIQYYNQPVDTTTPYDALQKMDLPKNLHIQKDYIRFHPDKDTKFNGKSAFPKSSTIVSGLKTRKKYEGYSAKRSWPC